MSQPGTAAPGREQTVALFDTVTPLAPLRAEIAAAIGRVLDGGRYILGPEVAAFEAEFARFCGAGHAVGVANGTEAITIALRAMGVGPGDEVIVPSFTFYASAEAIPPTGARVVFCDIDPATFCLTAETVRAALTPRTKAVDRRPPVRQPRPGRGDRGARRPGARGRRPGRRHGRAGRGAAGIARAGGDLLVLPVEEPRLLRRRRGDRDRRPGDRRPGPDAPLPRLARQGRPRGGRLQLAPRRDPGGDPPGPPPPRRRLGRRPAGGRRPLRGRPGSTPWPPCPRRPPGRDRPGTSSSCAAPGSRRWPPPSPPAGSAAAPTTGRRTTASRPSATRSSSRGPTRRRGPTWPSP